MSAQFKVNLANTGRACQGQVMIGQIAYLNRSKMPTRESAKSLLFKGCASAIIKDNAFQSGMR